jgi:predicted phosphodiesterase
MPKKQYTSWTRDIIVDGQTENEQEYLLAHANEHTEAEWSAILGRSIGSIRRKIVREGVAPRGQEIDPEAAPSPDLSQRTFQGIEAEKLVKLLRERPCALEELSQIFDRSELSILAAIDEMLAAGYAISRRDRQVEMRHYDAPVQLPHTLADERLTRLSVLLYSDTHCGDKTAQPTALRAMFQEAHEKYGVKVALHCGDVTAGLNVYAGQVQDLQTVSAEEQIEIAGENIPSIPGLIHYVLGGNHDFSFYRAIGLDVVQLLCSKREDMIYVGSDFAQIPLTQDLDVALWHPAGGVPYSLSYRGQRFLPQLASDELEKLVLGTNPSPRITLVAAGHLHQSMYFRQGHIAYFQLGCFEGRNSFFKRKGWKPAIGGYVVELDLSEGHLIHIVGIHDLWFYEIERDYQNYPRYAKKVNVEIKPLFWIDKQIGDEKDGVPHNA